MEKFVIFVVILGVITFVFAESYNVGEAPWRIHTLFSTECDHYFDWQTVGIMHSYRKANQPGPITRLLSCTDEEKKVYKGFDLAPTMEVPSMSKHPVTGDWYPAFNKPAGVVHWLKHSEDAKNVDWVVVLDADMIIRGPILPWELGVEKGRPVAQYYDYLIGCDNILAKLHTKHPELCDKVGGFLVFHIDDLRAMAPLWLSKTEEVREDRAHWATNITGDVYGKGWISEMYGYSFGAADVGLRHKVSNDLMFYPGYVPGDGVEHLVFHYGLPFTVGNWSFAKHDYRKDAIVYECGRLFPEPPYPGEVMTLETHPGIRRGLMLSVECMNMLNEALLLHHNARGCPKPKWTRYVSFLKSRTFKELTRPKVIGRINWLRKELYHNQELHNDQEIVDEVKEPYPRIHTIFSAECNTYFDWQTVGLVHSFHLSGQPGNITRLLSCSDEDLKHYQGHDLAPTHYVPSMSVHPLTGDRYPAYNKPAGIVHWIHHAQIDAEYVVILDTDMIMRKTVTPWEFKASRGRPVAAPYNYLIGCHTILAKLHTRNPEACEKVGGVIIIHIDDLRKLSLYWLLKTQEVRADTEHYATEITGDMYQSGWISEMYGYSFGAAELNLRHRIDGTLMVYPGYSPQLGVDYRVFHYGLEFKIGNWSFYKGNWKNTDLVNKCWAKFPDPPNPSALDRTNEERYNQDLLSIECARTLNEALYTHHKRRDCPDPSKMATLDLVTGNEEKIPKRSQKIIENIATKRSSNESNDSQESLKFSLPEQFNSRNLVVLLCGISFVGLFVFVARVCRNGIKRKTKNT